jgi:hypothetical protein
MLYEFALEPELVARWYDRNEYLFFDEKFGLRSRRIVSIYPKNWKTLVWAAFKNGPWGGDQNAQMRMTEVIQFLGQNSVTRSGTFSEIAIWLERAETEHAKRPFHAIIAIENPREKEFVIQVAQLNKKGHDLWIIPPDSPTARTAEEIASAVAPILRLCQHVILIDPYFDPKKRRFQQTIEAILAKCCENVCGVDGIQIELHTSIDRFFREWERGDSRDLASETRVYETFVDDCQQRLSRLVPAGIKVTVSIWKEKDKGQKLHNRYLLTNICGVMFGTGLDAADDPGKEESDDIVLLDEGQYQTRVRQYTGSAPSFDLVGKPFVIVGKSVA